jgi:hypothetical protein
MKKIVTLLFLLTAFYANAQRTMFGRNNKYVAPVGPPSLVSALVLDLDAGNSASYAGTGTTWTDLSGKGNHGTLVNSVTYNSANQGYLVFNGNGSVVGSGGYNPYVSLPRSTDFDFNTGDFTVELWAYTTTGNAHPCIISLNVNGSSYAAFRIEYWNGNMNLLHSYDGTSHVGRGSFAITLNAWQHIVVSRIAGSVSVYVNGVSTLTYSLPGSLLAQQNSRIGDFNGSNGYYSFSGNIATTKIYKGKGLTSTEVLTQFDLTKSRFSL